MEHDSVCLFFERECDIRLCYLWVLLLFGFWGSLDVLVCDGGLDN
jgi:hypothetical protein